jgi:hypothetical protein
VSITEIYQINVWTQTFSLSIPFGDRVSHDQRFLESSAQPLKTFPPRSVTSGRSLSLRRFGLFNLSIPFIQLMITQFSQRHYVLADCMADVQRGKVESQVGCSI